MKQFMLRSLMLLSVLLSSLGVSDAWAQLKDGKVYNFANLGSTGNSMTFTGMSDVSVATTNTEDVAQLWYVIQNEDGSYSLRNLATGKYLRSSNATSNKWTLVNTIEDNCKFDIHTAGNGHTLRATNTTGSHNYMHYGPSNGAVVCWEINATATHWGFNEVEIPTEDLQETFNYLSNLCPEQATINSYQQALDNLFEDKGCTILKSAYRTEDALTASSHYQTLPAKLQAMALKVCGDNWTENNYDSNKSEWDSDYAKKYRVQLYEPYNEPEAAASALGLNAHTNLNNPTGIFGGAGEPIYVMVDGTIDEGASLYITYYTGHGKLSGYSYGFELHTGLNVIPSYVNGTNFCINYVVHTFDTSKGKGNKAKKRKLSDYKDLKIHIEGGYINGYYNKVGDELYGEGDKNADWDYIAARATQKDVTILGKYITLQFPLNDADTEGNKGLGYYLTGKNLTQAVIDEWDNVMLWERLLLGVLGENTINAQAKKSPYSDKTVFEYTGNDGEFESDYSDYYNVHGLSFGVGGNSYMYGSWDHCGYHYNTMGSIIESLPTNAGNHWGPGHEIGHQHQELLNMRGLTEVTNNLFSNVVLWYFGETTSRYNGSEGALSEVLKQFNAEGTDFFSNNLWGQTIMYYKLFLYYHVLGHNPKFYPLLFEMLRQDPMTIGYDQDGSTCLMHFYKKCCLAAGEDLTEFFRAHGFFEVMKERFVGDYSNAVYNLTQAQIDAAIKEVKDLGYKENLAVLFINDATGETIKSYKGDNLDLYGETTVCAEVGCYADFNSEPSNYTYSISGTTVTMEGTGGVGFAILNENGELLGFSDKKTFEISAEAAVAIASGEASIVTLKGDNTQVATTNVMDAGDNATKYELLGNLLDDANALLDLSDDTGTKVGYYRTSALTDLQTAYTTAKGVYDEKTVVAYSAVYDVLFQEYADLLNNDYARINITEGYAYRLTNKAYPGLSMAVNTENNQMSGIATAESDAQLWYFEPGATKGTYYLKNKSTQKYPGDVSTSAVLSANKTEADKGNGAYAYRLQSMGNGIFALVGKTGLHCSASQNYNIVGWGADAEASQWYITAEALDEALEARTKLEELVGKAEVLIDEVGTVEEQSVERITLATDAYYCNALCINTKWDKFSSYSVLNDGDKDTYLHTDYSGADSEDGYAHYIRMDVGESSKVQMFKIHYTTRNYTYPTAPTSITVECSNDLTTWEPIETNFTEGLPTSQGTAFTTPVFGNGIKYRYIRFVVNSTDTNQEAGPEGNEHRYFALSELGISKVNYPTALNATYNTIDSNLLSDLYSGMLEANGTLATSSQADVLNAAYTTLYTTYKALLDAKTGVENTALNEKKAELQELINSANTLIAECGSVKYNEETTPQLNVSEAPYLLSDNNGNSGRGGLDKLYDGLQGEDYSYTSNWEDRPDEASYLQVDLGSGKEEEKLIFTFTNRNEGNAPTPTEIVVSASADGNTFTNLAIYTSEEANWPPAPNGGNIVATKWTSPVIKATSACRYWRFTVTKSQRSSRGEYNANGVYHFGISEFGIVIPAGCKVTVNEGMGEVNEALMLATYHEVAEAQSTITYATTEAQLDKAKANLQAQIQELQEAKNSVNVYKQALQDKIDETAELVENCAVIEGDNVTIVKDDAGDATKTLILETYNKVVEAQALLDAGTATQIQYEEAIETLEVQRATLEAATLKNTKAGLREAVATMNTKIKECGSVTRNGEEYVVTLDEENSGDVSKGLLIEAYEAKLTAEAILSASVLEDYTEATTTLNTVITTLGKTQQGETKDALRTAITAMNTKIKECGSVTHNGEEYVVTLDEENSGDVSKGLLIEAYEAKLTAEAILNASELTDYTNATAALNNAKTALEKAQQGKTKVALRTEIAKLDSLIKECALIESGEVVELYDAAGDATKTQLLVAYQAMVNANNALTASELTDYSSITDGIEEQYGILGTAQSGEKRKALRELTTQVAELIARCNTNRGDVSEVMFNELTAANKQALTLLQGDDLTAIAEKTTALQAQYTTVATAQQATGKSTLSSLIADMATLISQCTTGEGYVGDVTGDLLNTSTQAKDAAQAVVNANNTTTADFKAATETLQEHYNTLLDAKNSTAKAELRAMISNLTELIDECGATGTKVITTDVPCALQAGEEGDAFYISTNASVSEGDIANLVDGKMNTSFQTKNSVGEEQYLLVDAGDGNALKKFKFSYRPCKSPFPYTIVVHGSNNKEATFKELATFTDLPTTDDQLWTSSEIVSETAYRYLRFNITKSGIAIKVDDNKDIDTSKGEQLSNKYNASLYAETPQVEYCFAMSEFDLIRRVDNEGVQLTEAQQAIQEANDLETNSADATALSEKKSDLERLYNNLSEPLRAASQRIQVSLTTTDAKRDELLSGIEFGQTIGTFSAPYATVIPEGVTAYYATHEYEGGTVSLTPIEKDKALPANQGVILMGEVGVNSVLFIPADGSEADLSANKFFNSATGPETMASNDYILANGGQGIGFYKAKPGSTLKQGKAFFRFSAGQSANSFVLRFGGITTDIDAITTGTPSNDGLIYDIYGRRVTEVKKGGIYIKNGKKFFVK